MRYKRQQKLLDQEKLSKSTVCIVGLGGTGSAAAEYLARAGVNLILIDNDIVEEDNLHRQLYDEDDIGRKKCTALKRRLQKANAEIKIEAFSSFADISADLIIDCTDNMDSRFFLNDFCLGNKIPMLYTSAIMDKGMAFLILPGKTACFSCIFSGKNSAETCENEGVMGTATGFIGIFAANEALKYLSGKPFSRRLFCADFSENRFDFMQVSKRKGCSACSGNYFHLNKKIIRICGGYTIRRQNSISLPAVAALGKINKWGDRFVQLEYEGKRISVFSTGRIIIRDATIEESKHIADRIFSLK